MFYLISDNESDDKEENLFFITYLTPPPLHIIQTDAKIPLTIPQYPEKREGCRHGSLADLYGVAPTTPTGLLTKETKNLEIFFSLHHCKTFIEQINLFLITKRPS